MYIYVYVYAGVEPFPWTKRFSVVDRFATHYSSMKTQEKIVTVKTRDDAELGVRPPSTRGPPHRSPPHSAQTACSPSPSRATHLYAWFKIQDLGFRV